MLGYLICGHEDTGEPGTVEVASPVGTGGDVKVRRQFIAVDGHASANTHSRRARTISSSGDADVDEGRVRFHAPRHGIYLTYEHDQRAVRPEVINGVSTRRNAELGCTRLLPGSPPTECTGATSD